ncbi:MAG: TIM barrel protein [Alphaproteobacteria bacterium]|nr:TIM barrel protein [Alphaproteobacteria bacterium]
MKPDPAAVPLSLSYHTVPELSPLETARVAAETGCRHIGARLLGGQPGSDLPPIMTDPTLRRELRRCLTDNGISVLDANTARLISSTDIAAFRPFLEVAAELGARHVMASGDDPDEARLTANFTALCDEAAAFGMTVDIEFVPWLTISSLVVAARLVRAVNRDNLGIAVDALHFDRSRSRLSDLAALPAPWFRYAQICDAPTAWSDDRDAQLHVATTERLLPGVGGIDLVGLLRHLPSGIPLALEIPTAKLARTVPARERVARAVAATRRLLSQV